MILTLLRHGQSANNASWDRAAGDVAAYHRVPEPGLTALGRAQAARAAAWFASRPEHDRPTHLYCSLMVRAVVTAQPLADALGLPLVGRLDCFEVGGPYVADPDGTRTAAAGLTRAELGARYQWLRVPEWPGEDGWWPGPYESDDATRARARAFVDDLVAAHGPQDHVLVVTHQAFAQPVLAAALALGPDAGRFRLQNTAHTRLVWGPDGVECLWSNRLDHLEPDLRTG